MRCFILALGTRGDIEVYLALGKALRLQGHHVVIGTSPFYESRIRQLQLHWLQVGHGSWEEHVALLHTMESIENKAERLRYYFEHWLQPQRDMSLPAIEAEALQTDYFITNTLIRIRRNQFKLPGAVVIYDLLPTEEEVLEYRYINLYSSQLLESDYSHHPTKRSLILTALNRNLIDPKHQWPDLFNFTGFWYDETVCSDWQPPTDLKQFLAAGAPPVVLTMGSMVMFNVTRLVKVFIEALQQIGQRGIIVGGWAKLNEVQPALGAKVEWVHYVSEVPYDWLLPRASCLIHHGGTGTIGCALRAGNPSILLPQLPNQELCAQRLIQQKLAVDRFDVHTLTSEALATAIKTAITDRAYRKSALFWQSIVQSEHGVQTAIELIKVHWDFLKSDGSTWTGPPHFVDW